jgi:hypothetical protein
VTLGRKSEHRGNRSCCSYRQTLSWHSTIGFQHGSQVDEVNFGG